MEIGALISAIASVLVCVISGVFGYRQTVMSKKIDEDKKETIKRSEERKKESLLALRLTNANTKLTLGVAMAIKHGHANGEIEEGLEAVKNAQRDYETFLQELATEHLNNQ